MCSIVLFDLRVLFRTQKTPAQCKTMQLQKLEENLGGKITATCSQYDVVVVY